MKDEGVHHWRCEGVGEAEMQERGEGVVLLLPAKRLVEEEEPVVAMVRPVQLVPGVRRAGYGLQAVEELVEPTT